MRVFVTGASGYIGGAVARAFRKRGHYVFGLVRSEENAKKLRADEIVPVIGDLKTPQSYFEAIREAEVLVHTAFDGSTEGIQRDSETIDNFIKIAQTNAYTRQIIYTSGCWIYGNTHGKIVDEASPVNPLEIVKWRPIHEEKIIKATSQNIRTVVIRPGCVYGGSGGLSDAWFSSAQKGEVEIVGDGKNYCSMIHLDDLARAYVLASEQEKSGIVLNINDGSHHTIMEMAQAVAQVASASEKIKCLSYEVAKEQMGRSAQGLSASQKISNERARRLLGWQPLHASFIDEVALHYDAWKANVH